MANQAKAEDSRHALTSDVVLSRAQSSGRDDHVGAGQREREGGSDPILVVSDRLMMQHIHADLRQTLGHPLGVVVADLSQQDLGPYAKELGSHPASPVPARPARSHGIASTA